MAAGMALPRATTWAAALESLALFAGGQVGKVLGLLQPAPASPG